MKIPISIQNELFAFSIWLGFKFCICVQFVRRSDQWLAGPTGCVCEYESVIFLCSIGICSNSSKQQQKNADDVCTVVCTMAGSLSTCQPGLDQHSSAQVDRTVDPDWLLQPVMKHAALPPQTCLQLGVVTKCQITCERENGNNKTLPANTSMRGRSSCPV